MYFKKAKASKVVSGDNTDLIIVTSVSDHDRLLHVCSFQDAVASLLNGAFLKTDMIWKD